MHEHLNTCPKIREMPFGFAATHPTPFLDTLARGMTELRRGAAQSAYLHPHHQQPIDTDQQQQPIDTDRQQQPNDTGRQQQPIDTEQQLPTSAVEEPAEIPVDEGIFAPQRDRQHTMGPDMQVNRTTKVSRQGTGSTGRINLGRLTGQWNQIHSCNTFEQV